MARSPHPAWPLRLARGALSLLVLAALVVGAPWLLVKVGTLPTQLPSPGQVVDTLLAPDDGHVLMSALTLAAWVTWAWFVLSLLLEVLARTRRTHLHARPRTVRGFATGQRLAGILLGGLMLLPASTALASTPAQAHTSSAPARPEQPPAPDAEELNEAHAGPRHRVSGTGETVWDLAEQYLGDGRRYTEIRRLNPDLPQGAMLPAGSVVHLPADAHLRTPTDQDDPTSAATPADSSADSVRPHQGAAARPVTESVRTDGETDRTHTVQAGETLWGVAEEELGDGSRFREIFEANRGEPQPGGRTFTEPDLIFPGQELDLPQARPADPDDDQGDNDSPTPPDDQPPADDHDEEHPGENDSRAPADPSPSESSPETSESPSADDSSPPATSAEPSGSGAASEQPSASSSQSDGAGGGVVPPASGTSKPSSTASPHDSATSDARPEPTASTSSGHGVDLRTVAGAGALLAAAVTSALVLR
ncbi:LysM peptidoglycan-binding domain-containing protein, partial [Streptomyces sp. T-3]|nr:LysM peptidoglycan-binding domain-containing protein [Streptomyces sp. T-3]